MTREINLEVMRCPYCQQPATESIQSCPHCGFSVPGLDRLFGVPPQMDSPVADLAEVFSRSDNRRIQRAARQFHDRFPQSHAHTVTCHARTAYPVSLYAIWAFNRGGLCKAVETAGHNRDVLLAIDPITRSAALTLGYGLEPFVGTHHLENAVAAGRKELESNRFAEAVELIFAAFAEGLEEVSNTLDRTFGIDVEAIYDAELDRGIDLPIRRVSGDF